MYLTKKILLALNFTLCFTYLIVYLIGSTLDTINPWWFIGDEGFGIIMSWLLFGLCFLASISSILWLTNKAEKSLILKIPALLILPFSIPFLIIDYLESKKPSIREASKEIEQTAESKRSKQAINQAVFLSMIVLINYVVASAQSSIIFLVALGSGIYWYWFWMTIPLMEICGSIFLILYYTYHKKVFAWLSTLSLMFTWFYLLFYLIEKKKVNYFFKPKNTSIFSLNENSVINKNDNNRHINLKLNS